MTISGVRLAVVWAVLSAITVLSWLLVTFTQDGGRITSRAALTAGVVVIGLVKTRLIMQEFMEVRTAPTWLRAFTDGWLIVFWGAVLVIDLVSARQL